MHFLIDLWNLNLQFKRKPYPIPKIREMLLKLEGFKYAMSIDLVLGYWIVPAHYVQFARIIWYAAGMIPIL